jgi:heme/copper-type cytochrome/quinol oxidase subunit 2
MKYILTLLAALVSLAVNAQNSITPEQAEATGWRANGGVYIVMSVIAIILCGLFGYLVYIERRLSKLEENQN